MVLRFDEKEHKYTSIDQDNIDWISVTRVVSSYKNKFDPNQHFKSVKNPKSKWYGKDPLEVKAIWDAETQRSVECGDWYHKTQEKKLWSAGKIQHNNSILPVVPAKEVDGYRVAENLKLSPGCYPELIVYLKSAKICGQSDKVIVSDDMVVDIEDYKSNKEIERTSFKDWEGRHKMMLAPVDNLQDCNFNHYALQLSFYMYMIIKHNPKLKPGNLIIHHIKFELESLDANGYPIYKKDINGNFIVKEIEKIKLPYLKSEVIAIIKHKS
jgi:hypothetical protein